MILLRKKEYSIMPNSMRVAINRFFQWKILYTVRNFPSIVKRFIKDET